ncbi:hypothetical protein M409DRAFT_20312 [Zasmidium cellare ATCC 36951]|uniref:Uncharacterized protein n=1 Tax=Zasmidium cellare ATCC 36951 TaxID=1080233 RepID=A0A6A6CUN2_ZASCE|nr:uncharacterized protein M409DRAFT_20312 [Zasmidium cellare ATCC 36951]KAF2169898.1 hypothetical protein M409DRAFT_20312 [Zasmidium cellare ATCC 36951]
MSRATDRRIHYSLPELRSIHSLDRNFAPRTPVVASTTPGGTVGEIMTPRGPLLGSIDFSPFGNLPRRNVPSAPDHERSRGDTEIDFTTYGTRAPIPPPPPPPALLPRAVPMRPTVTPPRQRGPTVIAGPFGISAETMSLIHGEHFHSWDSPTGPHESLDAGIKPEPCTHCVYANKEWVTLSDGTTFELMLDSP